MTSVKKIAKIQTTIKENNMKKKEPARKEKFCFCATKKELAKIRKLAKKYDEDESVTNFLITAALSYTGAQK